MEHVPNTDKKAAAQALDIHGERTDMQVYYAVNINHVNYVTQAERGNEMLINTTT